jgi:DNA-binding CsgD family transcriptional regulator
MRTRERYRTQEEPACQMERLSALVGHVYDAALNPALWIDVLSQAATFVGGPAASLYSRNATSKEAFTAYQVGLDPEYVRLYLEKYARVDPTLPGYFFSEIGQPVHVADVLPYQEFLQTRFYREWARPQGWVDSVNVVLDRSGPTAAMFVVFRHERDGLVEDQTCERMRLIASHIRRAVLIGNVVDLKTVEVATFAHTLDAIGAGMFLVDAQARIVHANIRGHALLADASVLHVAGRKLGAYDEKGEHALHAVFLAASSGDAAVGTRGIAVPLTGRDGEHYVAHVLPLTSGARRRAGATYRAVAALFVHKTALEVPSPPQIIAKAYKLTPTELRVLLAIVEVGGVPEVAEALGIAETTVKTHLGRLFQKTGAARQADLIKVVGGYFNPLVG